MSKYDVQPELNREFMARLRTRQPATIADLNEGLSPRWQEHAAESCLHAGLIVEVARSNPTAPPKYALTEAGRVDLAAHGYGGGRDLPGVELAVNRQVSRYQHKRKAG